MTLQQCLLKRGARVRYVIMPTNGMTYEGSQWSDDLWGRAWIEVRKMRQVKGHVERFPKIEFTVARYGKARHEYKSWLWKVDKKHE